MVTFKLLHSVCISNSQANCEYNMAFNGYRAFSDNKAAFKRWRIEKFIMTVMRLVNTFHRLM